MNRYIIFSFIIVFCFFKCVLQPPEPICIPVDLRDSIPENDSIVYCQESK